MQFAQAFFDRFDEHYLCCWTAWVEAGRIVEGAEHRVEQAKADLDDCEAFAGAVPAMADAAVFAALPQAHLASGKPLDVRALERGRCRGLFSRAETGGIVGEAFEARPLR